MTDKKRPMVTSKAPGYSDKYANSIMLKSRLFNFWLQFGVCVPEEDNQITVEFFQGVLISPEEAKLLASWLSQEIDRYEKHFGPIPTVKVPGLGGEPKVGALDVQTDGVIQ